MKLLSTGVTIAIATCAFGVAPAGAGVCSIDTVTGVSFASYNVFDAAPVVAAGSITYQCTGVQPADRVVIELAGVSDASTPRTMSAGVHSLDYQLYLDAARTIVWGTGAGGTATYGPVLPAESTPTVIPIYGRIPARQDVGAGSYSATVLVILQL